MKATLIGYTQPTQQFQRDNGILNAQDLIAYCARVSNPDNQMNTESGEKLIQYLLKHKHFSPFEMVNALIEVETTRDIARQLLRHRSFTFQEFSQRYANPTKDLDFSAREARLQDHKNRQNSISTDDEKLQKTWIEKQNQIIHESKLAYKWAIDNDIAKEQARVVLPEGNTNSKLYVNGTIRSWIHYIQLRTKKGTQLEHILLAREIGYAIKNIFPMMEDFTST